MHQETTSRLGAVSVAGRGAGTGCPAHAALRGGGGRLRDTGRDLQYVARRVWGVQAVGFASSR